MVALRSSALIAVLTVVAAVTLAVLATLTTETSNLLTYQPETTVLCEATGIEDCQPVKKFDVAKLYKDGASIDLEHPNRIDFYGQMFQKFPEGTDTVLQKVFKLKKQLRKLAVLQAKFAKQLDHPVQTSLEVLAGEPGRLGKRGKRGPAGPPGFMGKTGPAGRAGFPGRPGIQGDEGNRGDQGPIGVEGDRGRPGVPGDRGPTGLRGGNGAQGSPGVRGPPGYAGEPGQQGNPGLKGNTGPRGTSPPGVVGSTGVSGAQGPEGPKGGQGQRGPAGPAGYPGTRGDPGAAGMRGKPGRDAKRLPASKCGMQDTKAQNVCCGNAVVNWHDYYSQGAYLDVDTRSCKFSDNNVMYFTEMRGAGGQWTSSGAQAIYSSSADGFRVYIAQVYGIGYSWWMNSLQHQVRWCGVGNAKGPKVESICCGVGSPSDLVGSNGVLYSDVSTKACQFGGDPIYLTSVSGRNNGGRSMNGDLTGTGTSYAGIGPAKKWFRIWLGGLRGLHWGAASTSNAAVYDYRVNWCGFGAVFPSGDMQVATGQITQDEYPCMRARTVEGNKVVSNAAQICCGKEDGQWKQKGPNLEKKVDASSCGFSASKRVAWLTSMRGTSSHWKVGGISAPIDPTHKGFSIQLVPWNHAVTVHDASRYQYQVQWCGIGEK